MQKTVLVVDDDDDLRSFLKKILISNNFRVIEAADGALALEAVEEYSPDLVLLDFGLPKVSGETVCVRIKQDHPETIVIALTEKTDSSDVIHGLQIGADDYISKPFIAEELIARIDTRFKVVPGVAERIETKERERIGAGKIILRESIVLVVLRLIFTEAIFGLSFLGLNILFSYLSLYTNTSYFLNLYYLFLAGGFLVNVSTVILIALKWNLEYSEISKGGIVKHSGILNRKEQKYACNFVEGVKIEQSFLGLILNYGTIELYDPALREQVYLLNIANPKKYSKAIQDFVAKEQDKPMPFIASENK